MKTFIAAGVAALALSRGQAEMVLEGDIVVPGGITSPQVTQPMLDGTGNITYVAEGQFATKAGVTTCTFSAGSEDDTDGIPGNTWYIRTQANSAGTTVEGCQPVDQASGTASKRLPRNNKRISALTADKNVQNKENWCFIGTANTGGNNGDGKAVYNALNGQSGKWNDWAYCTEQRSGGKVRYTVLKSFSEAQGFTEPGAPCAGEWNFNNNTNGAGGVKAGVKQSCLPFADYKPRTEGLDFSGLSESEMKYWCFIDTSSGAEGYNPVKITGSSLDPKTLDWGFCQDALDDTAGTPAPTPESSVGPEATEAPSASGETVAPSASGETTAPSPSGETSAPSSSGETTAPSGSESTPAPSVSSGSSAPSVSRGETPAPTPPTDGQNNPPNGASSGAASVLLAALVLAVAGRW